MTLHATLAHLGIIPKKSLGQNFMVEESALIQMVEAAAVGPCDVVLEIGAGLGALTSFLAARARRVVSLEVDGRFIAPLERLLDGQPHVEIVQADILQANLSQLLGDDADAYKVVANPPYYITSAIIRHLLESPLPPRLLVMTVQHEVAERLSAAPGDMSLLAVGVQFFGRPEIVARLKPGVFYPHPTVDSALVRIEQHPGGPPLPPNERARFFRIVRAGFSQPRKQLKNSLAAGLHLASEPVVNWLNRAGLDPSRRAETLSIAEWLVLYHVAELHLF